VKTPDVFEIHKIRGSPIKKKIKIRLFLSKAVTFRFNLLAWQKYCTNLSEIYYTI
jgi:hypothetical protein